MPSRINTWKTKILELYLKNAGLKNGKIRTFSKLLSQSGFAPLKDTTQQSIESNELWIADLEALIDCTESHTHIPRG
jgi:hypothetical protein